MNVTSGVIVQTVDPVMALRAPKCLEGRAHSYVSTHTLCSWVQEFHLRSRVEV